jgi:hypothetical protein
MIEATCHCGAVRIVVPKLPSFVTNCNCSIDRHLGALWVYYEVGTVQAIGYPENTDEYVWDEKTIRTLRCKHCGCVTHWEPLVPKSDSKLGVNARNFDPRVLAELRVRHLDGADTWKFLD